MSGVLPPGTQTAVEEPLSQVLHFPRSCPAEVLPSGDGKEKQNVTVQARLHRFLAFLEIKYVASRTARGAVATEGAQLGRDFRFLLGGSAVSMLGKRITTVAFPLLVLAVTHSPPVAGWCTFAAIAPSALMYLPAGVLVDRWDPRRVMLASALGRWAAVATIACAIALWEPSLPILTLAAATAQILDVFFCLAERRFLRSLIAGREQATSALVRSEARTHMVVLLGRPVGALLLGLSRMLPFAVDALSCLVAMAALARIGDSPSRVSAAVGRQPGELRERARSGMARTSPVAVIRIWRNRSSARTTIGNMTGEFRDGLKWLWSNLFAAIGLGLTTGTTLVSQALIMIFFAEAYSQDHSATKIGIVLAASGAGGVLGSAAAAWLFPRVGYPLLQYQMVMWCLIFFVLDGYGSQPYWLIASAMTFLGFAGAVGNIAIDTFMILHAGKMLARVLSIDRLTSFCALALGPALGGALYAFGAQFALNILFVITIALAVASLFAAAARHFGWLPANQHQTMAWATTGGTVSSEADCEGKLSTRVPDAMVDNDLPPEEARSGSQERTKSKNLVMLAISVVFTLGPAYLLSEQERQEAKAK